MDSFEEIAARFRKQFGLTEEKECLFTLTPKRGYGSTFQFTMQLEDPDAAFTQMSHCMVMHKKEVVQVVDTAGTRHAIRWADIAHLHMVLESDE